MSCPRPGDVLAVEYWWGRHVGVVIGKALDGEPLVAHCSRRLGRAAVEELAAFAEGRVVRKRDLVARVPPDAVVRRALSKLGTSYSFLTWNCEDYVRFALGLEPESPQRDRVFELGASVLVAALVTTGIRARR